MESQPDEETFIPSGAALAAWRQIYRLSKMNAPGFESADIPPEYLRQFEQENQLTGSDSPEDSE